MRKICLLTLALAPLVNSCAPRRPQAAETPAIEPATPSVHSSLPGKQADGSVLLPNQWSLQPAGRQVELGDFPVNIAVHPSGRFAALVESGYSQHEIIIVDVTKARIASRINLHEAF